MDRVSKQMLVGMAVYADPDCRKHATEYRAPTERFVEYEASDEPWLRYFGLGSEVETDRPMFYIVNFPRCAGLTRFAGTLACLLACCWLAGCKNDSSPPPTVVPKHEFKDKTPDTTPLVEWLKLTGGDLAAAMRAQAEDDKRIAELQTQHDNDVQTADLLYADKEAEIRKVEALTQAEIDRRAANAKRLFWGGAAAGAFGLSLLCLPMFLGPAIKVPKYGALLMLVGGAMMLAPSIIDPIIDATSPAVSIIGYVIAAFIAAMAVVTVRNNWIDANLAQLDVEADDPNDQSMQPREAKAIRRAVKPAYNIAYQHAKKRRDEREAMKMLDQSREAVSK